MNQFKKPDWQAKKVIAKTYKEWPLAIGLNPKQVYTSMVGTLETVTELGRDPGERDEYDFGKPAEEAFEIIMVIRMEHQSYWDPPEFGKCLNQLL